MCNSTSAKCTKCNREHTLFWEDKKSKSVYTLCVKCEVFACGGYVFNKETHRLLHHVDVKPICLDRKNGVGKTSSSDDLIALTHKMYPNMNM